MEFLKMNKLRKGKAAAEEEVKKENDEDELGKSVDEDDDDFIMNEVKRRLKELRRNSFMVLIPEEEEEEEEVEETPTSETEQQQEEWRDVEEEGRRLWSCFGAFYDKYCERMLFFDRRLTTHLLLIGSYNPSTPPPSKKFTSPLRCLSLKKIQQHKEDEEEKEEEEEEDEEEDADDLDLDLETSYVSQLCLTWEALHCQHTQLLTTATTDNSKCYNNSAQQFQQFQVLLQRFIENEPFQPSTSRPQIYAHARNSFPNLLQVPNILGQETTAAAEEDMLMRAPDLIKIIESCILTFQVFVKMDKKANKSRNLFGQNQHQPATPLQQVQSQLDKRKVKLKELWKRRKGGKKNEEVELLLGLIDVKVMDRVLRMAKITKDQLFWTQEKMKKLQILSGKLQRDPSPILFPSLKN